MNIPLLGTDYLTKPQEVLEAFRFRGEFFRELLIRVECLLDIIQMRLLGSLNIKVKDLSKAQYLIYELACALGKSDIFEIPEKEIEVLEKGLFELLNVQKPKKRSGIIANINRKTDTMSHLRAIIPHKKVLL